MSSAGARRRPPVYLLDVVAERGGRTRPEGALWDGVLNAPPEDDIDGPSPVEARLAAVAACFMRHLRWVADGAHIEFGRIGLHLAAARADHPPAISGVRLDVELQTDAPPARAAASSSGRSSRARSRAPWPARLGWTSAWPSTTHRC